MPVSVNGAMIGVNQRSFEEGRLFSFVFTIKNGSILVDEAIKALFK
jgi:hypothetical protein